MKLRKLKPKDAELMYEWMHDESVVKYLQTDFASKTIDDCCRFIENSNSNNIHLAITSDVDEYMGTVSLKNITEDSAEFAITIRSSAMGKGYSSWAMKEIIKHGFDKYKIKHIYWCVSPENKRAIKFYDKNGFIRLPFSEVPLQNGSYTKSQIESYLWYQIDSEACGKELW